MKKLEDIPKKDVFEAPEGYFEKLPGVIQSRVAGASSTPTRAWRYRLAYAGAVALIAGVAGVFWYSQSRPGDSPEDLLATVQTEALVAYLSESDMSTEELLDGARLNTEDALQIEDEVFGLQVADEDLDLILDDID